MKINVQRDGKIASELTLTKLKNGDLEIEYVYTDPSYYNQGLAGSLIDKAKKIATRMGKPLVAFIEPRKGGGLNYEQEVAWLTRKGFKSIKRYDYGGYFKPVMIYFSPMT